MLLLLLLLLLLLVHCEPPRSRWRWRLRAQIGEHSSGFGLKKITAFGSFALLVNNMTGAAIVDIPGLFQTAGWLTYVARRRVTCSGR